MIVQEQQKLLYVPKWACIWNKVQNEIKKINHTYDMNSCIGCFVLPTVYKFNFINAYKRNINMVNLDTTIWREKFIYSHDKNTKN